MPPSPPSSPSGDAAAAAPAAADHVETNDFATESQDEREKNWSTQPEPDTDTDTTPTQMPTSPPPPSSPTLASPTEGAGPFSPTSTDRVFPIRSVVSVNPTPTPSQRQQADYFNQYARPNDARIPESRRPSQGSAASLSSQASQRGASHRQPSAEPTAAKGRLARTATRSDPTPRQPPPVLPSQLFDDLGSGSYTDSLLGHASRSPSMRPDQSRSGDAASLRSLGSGSIGDTNVHVTHRFKHIVTEDGHAVITGRDGDIQRCEDEPIHLPGAIQGFGLLVALQEDPGGNGSLPVRIVSENSLRFLGRTPKELFALESFTDILSEEQADNLLDHIDFIREEDADVQTNGPEVFTMSIKAPRDKRTRKLWCAIHVNENNPGLIICEFEMEDDQTYPLVPSNEMTPELPEDTLNSNPTAEEFAESTEVGSRPLRVLRRARKRKGEAAAMEVFNIMSQVQEQLAEAPSLDRFLKVLVGVIKELTGFHRVMIYQFDHTFNGRVVTELVDPRATKDLYKGLSFPASDIPKQARELYKVNKVRMLYDRDLETARLVCRSAEDLERPLDLTHSYLRAMSPIHLKYLANMAVRSSMSVSINAFGELWGLIACHSYGPKGMRVSFPIRKMCRLVGDSASRNVERLSYASRLQARKLINTMPSERNPSGYIIASSDDLLKLFDADFGLLSIRDETKILGQLEKSQEALAMLEYLRMRKITSVMTSMDVYEDFPDLRYPPGFQVIAGLLLVPLSAGGHDFIVFFRKGQLKEVKWAGNPYEKVVQEGTEAYLEPRKSFKMWSEKVVGKCREWAEEEVETAAVLCLVYGKFIEVWRQKEAALQSSQLTRLLLANSAHEVRTPLNAIINYLEIALEGSLDHETRENLSRSHSASKSLIYVINDLLDLTKTEEGGPLIKGESFDIKATFKEATDMFSGDAKRKSLQYDIVEHPGLPRHCIGDQRRVRQVISNITANAIQNTSEGAVKVEIYLAAKRDAHHVDVEVAVTDTGVGMSSTKLDQLFNDLEQVQSEPAAALEDAIVPNPQQLLQQDEKTALGLGLAVVSRIIKNMEGQLRLKSEEGKGSRFVVQFPFVLPDSETLSDADLKQGTVSPLVTTPPADGDTGERTLVAPSLTRNESDGSAVVARKPSVRSMDSSRSLGSLQSTSTNRSQRSDVDRFIEAIQEPHMVERQSNRERNPNASSSRLALSRKNSIESSASAPAPRRRSLEHDPQIVISPEHRSMDMQSPGEQTLNYSATSLKAIKVPGDQGVPMHPQPRPGSVLGEVSDDSDLSAEHMRVLVAEDDPVNSKIVQKRLEKLGHKVYLTVNGEECATAYSDRPQDFDVILMDMQMPIVDGLASTKMIRSFEKKDSSHSPRAALNGRVPIIAVSASLIEKKRQDYIDAGFDAWILKPISFPRLTELMTAIVDAKVRDTCLYQPGEWEKGGWFHKGQLGPEAYTNADKSATLVFSNGADAAAEETNTTTAEEVSDKAPDSAQAEH